MKRSFADEQMDAADLAPQTYAVVLRDLARVNRLTLTARPTLAFVRRATKGMARFTLLDVGFGAGDMLRRVHARATRRGQQPVLTGVDLNPNSAAIAAAATPADMGIDWRSGDYADLGRFDLIVSSLVAHHMTRDQLIAFLRHMEAHATRGWFVNDLHRHWLAWTGFPLLARLFGLHRIVREDGTLSIARAFIPDEWRDLLAEAGITQARIVRIFPFRLCVERLR